MGNMNVEWKTLEEIRQYEKNPRKNEEAVQYVAKSIKEFGWKQPIVVDKDGVIIAGHTRYKAAKKLGLEKVPVITADDLTEEQVKAYRLADNKTGEFAQWDMDLLNQELNGILELDMDEFGFDIFMEDELDTENQVYEDDFDVDQQTERRVNRGDIWALGRHRLMCGDSTIMQDVSDLMGNIRVDLLLTDPPYNVALGMGGSKDEARKRHRRTDGLVIMNDKMKNDEFREFLRIVFTNAKEFMKEGAAFYIWYAASEAYNFIGASNDAGLQARQNLIWKKQSFTLGRQDYQWIHEPCLYGWKEGKSHNWYSDRKQSTVMEFNRPTKSELHPTMKPIELFDYLIKNSTRREEKVLDLFGGSGTTIMACEQNGRTCYTMEIDEKYADVILARWEKFTGQSAERIQEGKS